MKSAPKALVFTFAKIRQLCKNIKKCAQINKN